MPASLSLPRPAMGAMHRAAALWQAYPREVAGAALLGASALALAFATPFVRPDEPQAPAATTSAPPAPPPLLIRKLAPEQAAAVNRSIPLAVGPSPAASPFKFAGGTAARSQALSCLTSAVYYEAGSQSDNGERAVAQVVLNRVRHPAFPASICGVVYQGSTRATGCQFTFTCDGSLARRPDSAGWDRARRIAAEALAGAVYAPVGWATHYHADYVVPYWASSLAKNAVVGAHIFYRWAGGWGLPGAFAKPYGGREPDAASLRNAALSAEAATAATQGSTSVAAVLAAVPGAEKLAPSMRGDKRVAVRFNLAGRKAADQAPHKDYVEQFKASDNLRWALSEQPASSAQAPLGKPTATAAPAAGGGSAATPER